MQQRLSFTTLLYILFISLCFIFLNGYTVNSGDHEEHLPQVYQHADPELYTKDFFVTHFNAYPHSIRENFIRYAEILNNTGHLEILLFLSSLICILVSVYSFFRISQLLSSNPLLPYLSTFFIFIVFYKVTVGGNNLQYTQFVSSTPAKALGALALLFFFQKKIYRSALLLGFATLFQMLVGLQLAILLVLAGLLSKKISIKECFIFTIIYLIPASFMIYPTIMNQFMVIAPADKHLFYTLLFDVRNQVHYDPFAFPFKSYLFFIPLLVLGWWLISTKAGQYKEFFHYFFFLVLSFCLLHIVFKYLDILPFFLMLQWFKSTIWIEAFASVFIAIGIANLLSASVEKRIMKLLNPYLICMGILILCIPVFFSKYLPIQKFQDKYRIGIYQQSDLTQMHEWISLNTGKQDLFITFPGDNSFLCETKRSLPIHFRALVHEASYLKEWLSAVDAIYHIDLLKSKSKNVNLIAFASAIYNKDPHIPYSYSGAIVEYKLIDTRDYVPDFDKSLIVHQQGPYILLRLNEQKNDLSLTATLR